MAEIAEASELSLSTVFNYFPSKADIVFCVFDEILDGAEQRIASRRYGESGIRALGDWLRHVMPSLDDSYSPTVRRTPRIIASTSELEDQERLRLARFEDALAGSFASDLGEPPHGIRARVLAATALAELREVWHAWWAKHVDVAAEADHLIHLLEALRDAVRDLPTAPA